MSRSRSSCKRSWMRDLLHRLGYEFKKPKRVPGEGDREAQDIFVAQYEKFMGNRKQGGGR